MDREPIGTGILGEPITSVGMLLSGAADSAKEELYDFILGDPALYALLQKHGATRNDLTNIYHGLLAAGAGQWVRGHWVSASALCYGFTLEFVLSRFREGEAAHKNPSLPRNGEQRHIPAAAQSVYAAIMIASPKYIMVTSGWILKKCITNIRGSTANPSAQFIPKYIIQNAWPRLNSPRQNFL
jgi:hypothetical protein